MIFKFTNDIDTNEAAKNRKIKKSKTFSNKIVIQNGLQDEFYNRLLNLSDKYKE